VNEFVVIYTKLFKILLNFLAKVVEIVRIRPLLLWIIFWVYRFLNLNGEWNCWWIFC